MNEGNSNRTGSGLIIYSTLTSVITNLMNKHVSSKLSKINDEKYVDNLHPS